MADYYFFPYIPLILFPQQKYEVIINNINKQINEKKEK